MVAAVDQRHGRISVGRPSLSKRAQASQKVLGGTPHMGVRRQKRYVSDWEMDLWNCPAQNRQPTEAVNRCSLVH